MTSNQLKSTFRILWRGRLFTLLHIAGLAIGLSAAWLIWQYADFEYSHNRLIPNAENICRVVSEFNDSDNINGYNAGCPQPLWRAAEEVAGIEKSVPIQSHFALLALPEGAKRGFKEVREMAKTTPEYFELVPVKWLAGSPATALSQPDEVVLARSRAEKYFPRHSPEEVLGKTIRYESFNDTIVATVVGVVEDLDFPTSFIEKELLTVSEPDEDLWGSTSSNEQLWVILNPDADREAITTAINQVSQTKGGEALKQWGMSRTHQLQALADVHFADRYGSHIRVANAKVIKVLAAVAMFLLLLAVINYVNLSTAQIPARAREIGIRKTLGGSRMSIIGSFLLETLLVCLLATALAGGLTRFAFDAFGEYLPEDVLRYADWRKTGAFLAVLVGAVTLFSGLYPGWIASRFQAAALLRGQFSGQEQGSRKRGGNLRRGLIVFQFFVAQAFIIGALVVGQQLHFMRNSDLGFDRQAVLTIEQPMSAWRNPDLKNKFPVLADAFKKMPEIERVALGDALLSMSYSSNTHHYTDEAGNKKETNIYRKNADEELMDLYKLPLLAGRKLQASDGPEHYVINEAAVKAFGFESPQAAVGSFIQENNGPDEPPRQKQIVGVTADFHSMGFTEAIRPTAMMRDLESVGELNVRLASSNPSDWQIVLKKMETEWKRIYADEPFAARFYDETLADIYEQDLTLAKFIQLATGIAIFISFLGLFGLATFMAWKRTKEIGIRKVLGASAVSVVGMLSREFVLLVLAGFVLSAPVAYFLLQKWLQFYAYRIELSWWIFALAGAAALVGATLVVALQTVRAALANPVESLKNE
ncbi:MAG TPA: ABC transporter permease [Saprospiraceae bacterium]|nr:ABC transporter permease [Saprospiraceae bacterium]